MQLSCCAPGSSPAYYRCAGWMGLCPAGPAQGAPPPASPAPALPIPARHGPSFRFAPLTLSQSHNSTHVMLCAQIRGGLVLSTRAFERGALRPLSMRFSPKSRCIGKIFFWGSAPDPVMSDPTLDAPPRRSEGSCRPRGHPARTRTHKISRGSLYRQKTRISSSAKKKRPRAAPPFSPLIYYHRPGA